MSRLIASDGPEGTNGANGGGGPRVVLRVEAVKSSASVLSSSENSFLLSSGSCVLLVEVLRKSKAMMFRETNSSINSTNSLDNWNESSSAGHRSSVEKSVGEDDPLKQIPWSSSSSLIR